MTDLSFYEIASENSDKTTYLLKMELLTQSLLHDKEETSARRRLILHGALLIVELSLACISINPVILFCLGLLSGFFFYTLIEFIYVRKMRKIFQEHRDFVISQIGEDEE
jgi:hypothetical protein